MKLEKLAKNGQMVQNSHPLAHDLVFQTSLYALPVFSVLAFFSGDFITFASVVENDPLYMWYFVSSCILAGALNIVTVYNIRLNSAVGQNVCANLKDVVVVLVSIFLGQSTLNIVGYFGFALTILGGGLYAFSSMVNNICVNTYRAMLRSHPKSSLVTNSLVLVFAFSLAINSLVFAHWDLPFTLFAPITHTSTPQMTNVSSLLAAVTGGWDMEEYKTDERAQYLDSILSSYTAMCEFGFHVSVVLVAHEGVSQKWLNQAIDSKERWCSRIQKKLSIKVQLFPYRAPPNPNPGVSSDLAVRHREIFVQELENFDMFISQEDDVKFTHHNIISFLATSKNLGAERERYHPYLFSFERERDNDYVDWRTRYGTVFRVRGHTYYSGGHQGVGCCGYIVLRETLRRLIGKDSARWCDAKYIDGEFNPSVASWNILLKNSYTMVFDVSMYNQSGFHHMPNKYIRMVGPVEPGESEHNMFATATAVEQQAIFSRCLNESTERSSVTSANVNFVRDNCKNCLDQGKVVELRTDIWRNYSQPPFAHIVNVTLQC